MTLTCIDCDQPLYPDTARITPTGWRHVRCSPVKETCSICAAALVSRYWWEKLPAEERATAIKNGIRRRANATTCSRCAHAATKGRSPAERRAEVARVKAERLEDLTFMAETGESLRGAATRLDTTEGAIENFLLRANRKDLLHQLRRRNPHDHNKARDGLDITRAMPNPVEDRKQAKRNQKRKAERREQVAA